MADQRCLTVCVHWGRPLGEGGGVGREDHVKQGLKERGAGTVKVLKINLKIYY